MLSGSLFALSLLLGAVSSAQMTEADFEGLYGYSLRVDPRFPLGTDPVNAILKRTSLMGLNAVMLEIPLVMSGDGGATIDAASLRPGNPRELVAFIRRAQVFSTKVFFSLDLVDRDKGTSVKVIPTENLEGLYENFRRVVSYYAKVAQTNNVEGLILPAALQDLFCRRMDLKERLFANLQRMFHGSLFEAQALNSDGRATVSCRRPEEPARFFSLASFFTLENSILPKDWPNLALMPAVARLHGSKLEMHLGLGLAAKGQEQEVYWRKTLQKISQRERSQQKRMAFAARNYFSDPTFRGEEDESLSLLEKPSEEVLSQWVRQH